MGCQYSFSGTGSDKYSSKLYSVWRYADLSEYFDSAGFDYRAGTGLCGSYPSEPVSADSISQGEFLVPAVSDSVGWAFGTGDYMRKCV